MSSLSLPGEYPGVLHFCTTRSFGNLSLGCSEFGNPLPVREQLARKLGLELDDLVMTGLVHGNEVRRIGSVDRGIGARDRRVLAPADAVFTTDNDLWLLMTAADCYPILVSGPGCLGLAHAGWRGVLAGILPSLIEAMSEALGLPTHRLRVGIGPGIGPSHFQLGPDEIERFRESGCGSSILPDRYVNLPEILTRQAREAGVGEVGVSGLCTYAESDRFFSYRREDGKTGRFGLAARLLPS